MSDAVKPVTDADFDAEVLNHTAIPVLVDFWAEWCGPCRHLAPALEALAKDLASQVKVVKVNVEDCPQLLGRFNIRGIPALLLFKGGQVAATRVGFNPGDASKLRAWVASNL